MTPREVVFAQRGFQWRQEQEQWRTASVVAAMYEVNRNRKKRSSPFTAKDFMPKKRGLGARTPEAQLEAFRRLTLARGGTIRTRESNRPRRHPEIASTPQ